ncbi:FAD-binding protein [Rhodobacteraceae bacterium KMM 6894]|nr:FAD-binding protein [Rhodobacteraceae bacterium KMM 6894]
MCPDTEDALAGMITAADGPFQIVGGGTRGFTVQGAALSTAALSGISLYEPGAMTLVVRAGTPMAEVDAALAVEGQRLAFEPMDHRAVLGTTGEPTIGGAVAANVSGPRRIQVGACRDFLLGVRFVDGQGRVLKNGGRVMKNVTGYDLVKLMAGSYGTLGVMTELSLKVMPVARSMGTLVAEGLSDAAAVQALSAALGTPFDVSGAAHVQGGRTMVRLEGFAASVAYRAAALQAILAPFGAWALEMDNAQDWQNVRDVAALHGDGDLWRLSVKPSDAPGLVARVSGARAVYDWAGGLIWLAVPEGTDVRTALGVFGGHATLIRADIGTKQRLGVFQPQPAPLAAIEAGLRARFDPRGLFNPGVMHSAVQEKAG